MFASRLLDQRGFTSTSGQAKSGTVCGRLSAGVRSRVPRPAASPRRNPPGSIVFFAPPPPPRMPLDVHIFPKMVAFPYTFFAPAPVVRNGHVSVRGVSLPKSFFRSKYLPPPGRIWRGSRKNRKKQKSACSVGSTLWLLLGQSLEALSPQRAP